MAGAIWPGAEREASEVKRAAGRWSEGVNPVNPWGAGLQAEGPREPGAEVGKGPRPHKGNTGFPAQGTGRTAATGSARTFVRPLEARDPPPAVASDGQ